MPALRPAVAALAAALTAALATAALTTTAPPARAAGLQEVTGFGTNPGNLQMFRYVPDGLPPDRPVVVALHGCTQNAASYATGTGWTKLADQWRFSVVFPQQRSANNLNSCFNWFEPGDTRRGAGEALSIKQMVDRVKQDVKASSAYVSGLSAGGAMTAVMLATYPDVFAGGGVVAGLPYGCATAVAQAFGCMNPGVNLTPAQWGDKVRAAYAGGPRPKVSIWHGTADTTVVPANAGELVEQWTDVHGTDQTPDVSDTVAGYPHRVYGGVVELYQITGMGHGHPVDPGTGPTQCGTAGAYVLDVDICSAYHLARFWGITTGTTPTTTTSTAQPVDTATGTATQHYVAGRIGVTDYNTLGARYGYTTAFTLYRCPAGWTDKPDCSPI
ncbi:extracellular catalytic domain type 1 short-chain-length polyhydroxyalkanoate depolymerase [Saccharothrix syringae]|uniref:PHB depolymerase family esterase n=1 Tax=Saccharothrix syringae TaxID=103733 RepID=A0A5Q0H264_SACSY|nr:PHB depolymerase family esterase [Saccharothrix syringae]QFZ20203.1 PHB depolymerase family esterase [Saccharothrix syringae]